MSDLYLEELKKGISSRVEAIARELVDAEMEPKRIQYLLARRIYRMNTQLPPAVQIDRPMGDYTDWCEFFEGLYGESLDEYIARARAEDLGKQVKRYEADHYAFTGKADQDHAKEYETQTD